MDKQSHRNRLEQGRAQQAYKFAKQGSELNKDNNVDKAYKSYVKKIPMLIKTNGLGATFAFVKAKANQNHSKKDYESKKDYAYEVIYHQTEKWLKECMPHIFQDDNKDLSNQKLIYVFISQDSNVYHQITVELLAFFTWLKRFAEGLIEGEEE